MRIISGKHKSFRFNPPKNFPSRPTTDQAKEALFNIINNWYYIEDIKVLDLFSGTGNISIEFASRGCKQIVAVEKNSRVVRFAQDLYKKLGITEINQLQSEVFTFLDKHSSKYDLIFADPPFKLESLEEIPNKVFEKEMLTENGTLIIEHGKYTDFSSHPNFDEMRNYGGVQFSFFENKTQ